MKGRTLWLTAALSLITAAVAIRLLPDTVPIHFNLQGEVDRFGSKWELLVFPLGNVIIALVGQLSVLYFSKKERAAEEEKTAVEARNNSRLVYIISVVIAVFHIIVQLVMIFATVSAAQIQRLPPDITMWTLVILGAIMAVMGNLMPKSKRNALFGLRTSWSMYNDETWAKSNRFGGAIMLVSGVITIAGALAFKEVTALVIAVSAVLSATIAATIYSYIVYKEVTNG